WPALLGHSARHQLDGGLHGRHAPLGFLEALQACLPETGVRRHVAQGGHLWADICRNEPTVAPHATLHSDQVVGLSARTDARGGLLALGAEPLTRLARRWRVLCELL